MSKRSIFLRDVGKSPGISADLYRKCYNVHFGHNSVSGRFK